MGNRMTVRKWFWVWDFEKEEDWLNEMALNGWVLDGVSFCTYHFVRCEPGEYSVRLEMHPYDESFLAFMKETGAEYLDYYTPMKAIPEEEKVKLFVADRVHLSPAGGRFVADEILKYFISRGGKR